MSGLLPIPHIQNLSAYTFPYIIYPPRQPPTPNAHSLLLTPSIHATKTPTTTTPPPPHLTSYNPEFTIIYHFPYLFLTL